MSTTTSPPSEPTTTTDSAPTDRERALARSGRGRTMVPLLLRLHFYAGVLVAPFLAVAALSGLAFVFTPQLDRMVYADELFVDRVGEDVRPLAEQVAAARQAHPDGTLASIIPPVDREGTTKVVFSVPELGEKQHTVYVDPYTNTVKGTLTTWFGETPLMTWIDDLHRNLHLGTVGRHYSELAASWLWVLVLGGLTLWLSRQWNGRRRLRRTVLPDLAASGVRRTRGWHAATGVWLAIGLLALSATGLTWSRFAGGNFDLLQNGLGAHQPALDASLAAPGSGGEHDGAHHEPAGGGVGLDAGADVDRVIMGARQAGLTGPVEAFVPEKPGFGWTVTQIDNDWPVGHDRAVIDPATGTVVTRSDFADWPVLAQLSKLGVAFHMGYLFGLVNQIVLTALGLGLLCVIVWGYRMWWQRRPTRTDRTAPVGAPPSRGAWRRMHPAALTAWLVAVAAVSWAMPLLGLSLLAFLAVDLLLGLRRRRPALTK